MKQLMVENIPELPYYMTEALNQLRISLGFAGENIKSIMITSSTPNEGKSFITMQLWKMMAEAGNRVIVIDCDMRNSEMRTQWGFALESGDKGLVHCLSAKADINDIVYATNIKNAYIIPTEVLVPNPINLLEGRSFKELMTICRREFDYILIDTPPLGAVADALSVGPKTDGCLLVIRSAYTPKRAVENSVNLMERSGVPLLGIVLNRADTNRKGNYYYNQYYRYGDYKYNK